MAKGNIYWCDDCGKAATPLDEIYGWEEPPGISWCPNCGRLEDDDGTVTPRESKHVADKIAKLALDGLVYDGEHHKQWYLEQILEAAGGEDHAAEMFWEEGWKRGIAP